MLFFYLCDYLCSGCSAVYTPLVVALGSKILLAAGHGAAYKLTVAEAFKQFAGAGAIGGIATTSYGVVSGLCGVLNNALLAPYREEEESSSSGMNCMEYTIVHSAIQAAFAALGTVLSETELNAGQAAVSALVGHLTIKASVIGVITGVVVIGGTCYCFYKCGEKFGCCDENGNEHDKTKVVHTVSRAIENNPSLQTQVFEKLSDIFPCFQKLFKS